MRRRRLSVIAAAAATALLAAGWSVAGDTGSPAVGAATSSLGGTLEAVNGPLVVAVGDVACEPGSEVTATTCQDAATAELAAAYDPAYVLSLGDQQYQAGRLSDFHDAYHTTWGRFRSITRPVPGNHEYRTARASGYFRYFGDQTRAPGYYAFNVNGWRIYALNSNCSKISCRREAAWLRRDMDARPRRCSAIMMHHPLYSSGLEHGDSPEGRRFWKVAIRHRAELALAGHDHDYERFRSMDAGGSATRNGLVSFVVGAGGKSLYGAGRIRAGSVVFDNHRAGVLALTLGRGGYAWEYQTIDGEIVDSGIGDCR